ncbi:DUF4245 domain-containing protein [Dactylosporangium vinaceum]|uniref:DUF4245 domain-containing protein n=1 Tax=Dactylosporangium vinaceum TaxID=53362 RepID=A0ABV5MI47_9ACTN|nr:DUF4245 domain-containing protein [Dactylosporangium vinaceum]UAB97513.1 DUF4245 domain-containing protein [Dactylosporangium vinaceum]
MGSPTQQEAPRAPKARRPRDMALSMLVLIIPVFLIVAFYRYLGHEDPPVVDTTEVYGSVQRAGRFELLRPEGLADGWRIASATYTDGILRIGITAPDSGALQLVESADPAAVLVPAIVGKTPHDDGPATIAGAQWHRWSEGRPGERAIVRTDGNRTVIIVGHAKQDQLDQLAGSLRA